MKEGSPSEKDLETAFKLADADGGGTVFYEFLLFIYLIQLFYYIFSSTQKKEEVGFAYLRRSHSE